MTGYDLHLGQKIEHLIKIIVGIYHIYVCIETSTLTFKRYDIFVGFLNPMLFKCETSLEFRVIWGGGKPFGEGDTFLYLEKN